MIDPEKAKWDDFFVPPSPPPTEEEFREISAFIKAYKAKQEHAKKSSPLPATRKHAKPAAK